jgi:hypothetical protein
MGITDHSKDIGPVSPLKHRQPFQWRRTLRLIWWIGMVTIPSTIAAQTGIQLMGTAGYEFTRTYAPVYDLTLLLYQRWGIRLTHIPDFPFNDGSFSQANAATLTVERIRGDLDLPLILRTVDYRSHAGAKNTPLDFATAYFGLGHNRLSGTSSRQSYTSVSNRFEYSVREDTVEFPVTAFTAGMCVGESFLVFDFYLLYLRGHVDSTPLLDRSFDFEHWLLTAAIGIAF